MHCYLFTSALVVILIPLWCCYSCFSDCRSRELVRAVALRDSAEEARSMEESSVAAPSEIVVTGVVIATEAPSAQATLVSSEGAVIYEIAPAVVIRGPL